MRHVTRGLAASVCCLALGLGLAGCSGGDAGSATTGPASSSTPVTPPSTAPAPTLALKDAPLVVTIERTAGNLPANRRAAVKARLGRVVNAWMQAGFVGGDYPRAGFAAAFAHFTPGAARSAKRDRALLTNAALGPKLVDVAARRRSAQLSVLAARRRPRGASARVDLVLAGVRDNGSVVRLDVSGDLYLTRSGGTWKIFGFDLSRSVRRLR